MKKPDNQVKDVVCGMRVNPNEHAIEYLQMDFAFCSKQCQARFLAHPHLYIGYPGHKAPKQEEQDVIKRRRIPLGKSLSPEQITAVSASLQSLMGIKDLKVEEQTIEISYDLLQVSAQLIESTLTDIGIQLGSGWAERLRRAFVHESEELQIDALEVNPATHHHH